MHSIKTRLDRLEPIAQDMQFHTTLAIARQAPPAQFVETLLTWAEAIEERHLLALTEDELLLMAGGEGFATYFASLDKYQQIAVAQGKDAMAALGVETFAQWQRRHKRQ